jgi:hypothetical protein
LVRRRQLDRRRPSGGRGILQGQLKRGCTYPSSLPSGNRFNDYVSKPRTSSE